MGAGGGIPTASGRTNVYLAETYYTRISTKYGVVLRDAPYNNVTAPAAENYLSGLMPTPNNKMLLTSNH